MAQDLVARAHEHLARRRAIPAIAPPLARAAPSPATGCAGCRVPCCRLLEVPLGEDEAASGRFRFRRAADGVALLARDERTGCGYLRDGRCSIYDERPRACRAFDCTGDGRFDFLR